MRRHPLRISNDDFDRVQKRLQAQRAKNDDGGRRRELTGAIKCDGCGSHVVVFRTSRDQCYYRCRKGMLGDIRYRAGRTVTRVPD